MQTTIINKLQAANISTEGINAKLPMIIENAVDYVESFGLEAWEANTTAGVAIKSIVKEIVAERQAEEVEGDNIQSLEVRYHDLNKGCNDREIETQIFFSWADFEKFDKENNIYVKGFTWICNKGYEYGSSHPCNAGADLYTRAEELGLWSYEEDNVEDFLLEEEIPVDPNSQEGLEAECKEALTNEDYIFLVCFSGGKDSVALVLKLLADGVAKNRIVLHHHEVDGGGENLFDWEVTTQYCRAFAEALGLEILFSFREGGILREMYRENEGLQDVLYQQVTGGDYIRLKSRKGSSTRRKFPAVAADLRTRWCSSAAKIDVLSRVVSNHPAYKEGKFIVCTGERREESANRAKYNEFEVYRANSQKRRAIQWRAIIDWTEEQVWGAMEFFKIQCHPCYELGWGRCSCQICIFSNSNTWASIQEISPLKIDRVFGVEVDFEHTLYNGLDILDKTAKGTSFVDPASEWVSQATEDFNKPIFVTKWEQPKGAYSENKCGSV